MLPDMDIPFDVTALIWCCCRACSKFDRTPACAILTARDLDETSVPAEDRWHYCSEYQGPFEPGDVWFAPAPARVTPTVKKAVRY